MSLPKIGPGPFRRGAGMALFLGSWTFLLIYFLDWALIPSSIFNADTMYQGFLNRWGTYPWPIAPLAPYLSVALASIIAGGSIAWAWQRLMLFARQMEINWRNIYRQAYHFIKSHWKFSLAWIFTSPFLLVLFKISLARFYMSQVDQLNGNPSTAYTFLFTLLSLIFLNIGQGYLFIFALVYYLDRFSSGNLAFSAIARRSVNILIRSLGILLTESFLIALPFLFIKNSVSLVVILYTTWVIFYFIINSIYWLILVAYPAPGLSTFLRTLLFLSKYLLELLRLPLDLLRRLLPLAYPLAIYLFWADKIGPEMIQIHQGFKLDDPSCKLIQSTLGSMVFPYTWLVKEHQISHLSPMINIVTLWLWVVLINLIIQLKERDLIQTRP
jgi:hypothetical protein